MNQNLPLTDAQQAMWLLHQFSGKPQLFNVAECLTINGRFDRDLLQTAINLLWQQADTLACRFTLDANFAPCMQFDATKPQLKTVPMQPSSALDSEDAGKAITEQDWVQQALAEPFAVETAPLMRFVLQSAAEHDHLLVIAHHLLLDGYGFALVLDKLARCYNTLAANQPSPTLALGSQQALLTVQHAAPYQQELTDAKAGLLAQLQHASSPARFIRHSAPLSQANIRHHAVLPALTAAEPQLASNATSRYLAAIAACLYWRTNNKQILFGLVMMNRRKTAQLITPCYQSNIVPLQLALSEQQNLWQLCAVIDESIKTLRSMQSYRIEWLKKNWQQQNQGQAPCWFSPTINLLPFSSALTFGDHICQRHIISAGCTDDLMINIELNSAGADRLSLNANGAVYSTEQLATLSGDIALLLQRWSQMPQLSLCALLQQITQIRAHNGA